MEVVDRLVRNTRLLGRHFSFGAKQLSVELLDGRAQLIRFLVTSCGSLEGGREFALQSGNRVLEPLLGTLSMRRLALSRVAAVVEFRTLRTEASGFLCEGVRLITRRMRLMQLLLERRARSLMLFDLSMQSLHDGRVLRHLIAESIVLLHHAVEGHLHLVCALLCGSDRRLELFQLRVWLGSGHRCGHHHGYNRGGSDCRSHWNALLDRDSCE